MELAVFTFAQDGTGLDGNGVARTACRLLLAALIGNHGCMSAIFDEPAYVRAKNARPNPASAVDAPIMSLLHTVRSWRRATDQHR